jgi:hypothetical protein
MHCRMFPNGREKVAIEPGENLSIAAGLARGAAAGMPDFPVR